MITMSPIASPRRQRQPLQPLLDQQFWCWGYDVRGKENWLLRYGFTRARHPEQRAKGSSRYVLVRAGLEIRLWAFGATVRRLEEAGTALVARYTTKPHFSQAAVGGLDVHRIDDLPPFRSPTTPAEQETLKRLMALFCRFVAEYEAWLHAQAGEAHRRGALAEWMHKPCCPANEIPERWQRLPWTHRT
jgi:hypothetical protein